MSKPLAGIYACRGLLFYCIGNYSIFGRARKYKFIYICLLELDATSRCFFTVYEIAVFQSGKKVSTYIYLSARIVSGVTPPTSRCRNFANTVV